MPAAEPELLNFLRHAERYEAAEDSVIATRWGDDAGEVQQSSYLATKGAAAAEAARQQALTGNVLARDQVVVNGLYQGIEGTVILVTYPRHDYEFGRQMLVTAVEVDLDANTTVIEGLVVL